MKLEYSQKTPYPVNFQIQFCIGTSSQEFKNGYEIRKTTTDNLKSEIRIASNPQKLEKVMDKIIWYHPSIVVKKILFKDLVNHSQMTLKLLDKLKNEVLVLNKIEKSFAKKTFEKGITHCQKRLIMAKLETEEKMQKLQQENNLAILMELNQLKSGSIKFSKSNIKQQCNKITI